MYTTEKDGVPAELAAAQNSLAICTVEKFCCTLF
jgi:hypothetical protein